MLLHKGLRTDGFVRGDVVLDDGAKDTRPTIVVHLSPFTADSWRDPRRLALTAIECQSYSPQPSTSTGGVDPAGPARS
ncbi:hypothetical protein GCM10023159_04020 [Brevibacterium yomogidense]